MVDQQVEKHPQVWCESPGIVAVGHQHGFRCGLRAGVASQRLDHGLMSAAQIDGHVEVQGSGRAILGPASRVDSDFVVAAQVADGLNTQATQGLEIVVSQFVQTFRTV
ncbi:hypothetical protein D9M68_754210 [compost metagenome]